MDIVIRRAVRDDAAAAWDIRNTAILAQCAGHYPDDLLKIWTDGSMTDRFVEAVADRWYVAEVADTVVGTGTLDTESGHVDAIFVRPDMIRQGIGRSMMQTLEQVARRSGLRELKLDSTLNAAPFYRSCGFSGDRVSVYRSPRGISLDCVPMTKKLTH